MSTEVKSKQEQQRYCVQCGSPYATNSSAKRQYCSDNCRVAHHRQKQSITIKEQQQAVEQQATELKELKAAPISRTESVQVINVDWQVAQQGYEAQAANCNDLKAQLTSRQQETIKLTSPILGANLGACAGVACVLIWMAFRYDNRKDKPLVITFSVVSVVWLLAMGLTGYWLGQATHRFLQTNDEQKIEQLAELDCLKQKLAEQIKEETAKLNSLRTILSRVPKYESETVTIVDEMRTIISSI